LRLIGIFSAVERLEEGITDLEQLVAKSAPAKNKGFLIILYSDYPPKLDWPLLSATNVNGNNFTVGFHLTADKTFSSSKYNKDSLSALKKEIQEMR